MARLHHNLMITREDDSLRCGTCAARCDDWPRIPDDPAMAARQAFVAAHPARFYRLTFRQAGRKTPRTVWAQHLWTRAAGRGGALVFEMVNKYCERAETRELLIVAAGDIVRQEPAALDLRYSGELVELRTFEIAKEEDDGEG